MKIRITEAQYAALEQQCFDDGPEAETMRAWRGRALVFTIDEADTLADLLTDLSNGEDCHSEAMRERGHRDCATAAGRVSRSLAAMAGNVRRAAAVASSVPRCRGYNYHVFALGASACSICAWDRYATAGK